MFTTLALLFLAGPVVGAISSIPAMAYQTRATHSWRHRRLHMWGITAAECFGLVFIGSAIVGSTVAFSAVVTVLSLASFFAYGEDPQFQALALRLRARALLALKVLVNGKSAVDTGSDSDGCCGDHNDSHCGDHEEPQPTICPMTPPERFVAPEPAPVAPVVSPIVAPSKKGKGQPASEAQILAGLLSEIQRLQQAALRPESERRQLAELTAATKSTEQALRQAVGQLESGTVNWKDIKGHVDGLKKHELPTEVAAALDALVDQHSTAVASKKGEVSALVEQLQTTRGELNTQLTKPALTPEEALAGADSALADAAKLTKPQQ